jgi:hypothetical protein
LRDALGYALKCRPGVEYSIYVAERVPLTRGEIEILLGECPGADEISMDPPWDEYAELIDGNSIALASGTLADCIRQWLTLSDKVRSPYLIGWGDFLHGTREHGRMTSDDIHEYLERNGPPPKE